MFFPFYLINLDIFFSNNLLLSSMLKIIPLIIIPLFFFIIFLGVENLTQISDAKKENLVDQK